MTAREALRKHEELKINSGQSWKVSFLVESTEPSKQSFKTLLRSAKCPPSQPSLEGQVAICKVQGEDGGVAISK